MLYGNRSVAVPVVAPDFMTAHLQASSAFKGIRIMDFSGFQSHCHRKRLKGRTRLVGIRNAEVTPDAV